MAKKRTKKRTYKRLPKRNAKGQFVKTKKTKKTTKRKPAKKAPAKRKNTTVKEREAKTFLKMLGYTVVNKKAGRPRTKARKSKRFTASQYSWM